MPTKKENKIEQQFFNKLAEKLEEIFPKTNQDHPEIPSEGNRSGALAFNAYANIYLKDALKAQEKEVIEIIEKYLLENHDHYGDLPFKKGDPYIQSMDFERFILKTLKEKQK